LTDKFFVGKELADRAKPPGFRENCSSKYSVSVHGNICVLIMRTKGNPAESLSAVTWDVYLETKGRLQYFMFRNLKSVYRGRITSPEYGASQFRTKPLPL
jgi:hypothetical protein